MDRIIPTKRCSKYVSKRLQTNGLVVTNVILIAQSQFLKVIVWVIMKGQIVPSGHGIITSRLWFLHKLVVIVNGFGKDYGEDVKR